MSTKPNGIVEAGTKGITMLPGYQDEDGDYIDGPDGNDDIIFTKNGDNYVDAGQGDDIVAGGTGNDTILGNDGDDTLFGGKGGDDNLEGGEGDDVFLASKDGEDTMQGGEGRDTYWARSKSTGGSGSGSGTSGTVSGGSNGSGFTGSNGSFGSKFKATFGTQGIDVNVNDDGFGTVYKQKSEDTDSVESVEHFIAPETKNGDDSITLTDSVASEDVVGLDDNSVGTFTLVGGGSIAFGPGEDYKLSNLLNGTAPGGGNPIVGPLGSYQITDGDENGMVGNISFENFETINFVVDSSGAGSSGPVGTPGPVDGLESGENMPIGYTDAQGDMIDGTDGIDDTIFGNGGDDTIDAGLGNDTVEGGDGNDVIFGNDGDDLIYGDEAPGATTVRESFEWDKAPDPNGGDPIDHDDDLSGGFSQDTGNVTVTFTETSATSNVETQFASNDQNVSGIDGGTETPDDNSSLSSTTNGNGQNAEYELDFSDEVENVSFRVNDIDGDGIVSIKAFDALGNPIEVNLTGGSRLTLQDNDGIAGNETADSQGGYAEDTNGTYSLLVEIPGPVSRIVIEHSQDGGNNTGVNVTDVFFDATLTDPIATGDDEIDGGLGDDTIFGGDGNDTLTGGDGEDSLSGDNDRDLFVGGNDGDTVDGGAGGDDFDTLDLRGRGPIEILGETDDPDGNSTSGTIMFENGDTMEFREIEQILSDPRIAGPVDGLNSGEDMGPGYTDAQGDMIDGTDGIDDTIFGNGGDDTIDSGLGDDTVDGGAGDDVFAINEEGNGIDNDVIIGGETDENNGGDVLDASDIGDDLFLDITSPEEGTLTDGDDTTAFEEIEQFILGSGDDTAQGSVGDDNVDGGGGNDDLAGYGGDDTLTGGDGEDTIHGGDGDDSLDGGDDNDSILGGDGSDTVDGGDGDDVINTSGGGANPLPDIGFPPYAGLPGYAADSDPDDDRDFVMGGAGDDTISTGDDADTIDGGLGNDVINSGIDDDEVLGQGGHDTITAGEGNDLVDGGSGNDVIYGGLGPGFPDAINIADDGSDPFGADPVPNNGMDTLYGNRGNDVIYGEDDDDLIFGGTGADTLFGGKDDDTIDGGAGQDDITGGQGIDSLLGGADRDEFFIDTRSDAYGDTVDGGTDGNDVDTLNLRGLGRIEIVGETVDADGDSTSGTVNFLDATGNVEGTLVFREIENLVVCFTPGTLIGTARGEVRVEMLREGDRVVTRDNGVQEIRWVGHKTVGHSELLASPEKQPVLVRKGSLGKGLPERDMMLSPNHKVLVANDQSALYFEEREVLAAAKHLVHNEGISQLRTTQVTYIHFMFDHHEVVLSDGTWTESFQPGDYSLAGIDGDQREEIYTLFPELRDHKGLAAYGAARNTLKRHEAELLSF